MNQNQLDEIRAVEYAFELTPKGVNSTGQYLEYLREVVPELIAEIERLRKEVNALENKEMNTYLDRELENERLEAEVERLKSELARLRPSPDSHRQTNEAEK